MGWIILLLSSCNAASAADGFDPFVTATPLTVQEFGHDSDHDYDGLPDGWTRRSGPGFPNYIDVRIDRRSGHDAPGSLRIVPDGAPAAIYGSPVRIDDGHLYVFEAFVRTQRLRGDAAVCSVSVLDERQQRIGRQLSVPVSGTHRDWVRLRVGPIEPIAGQRFLVLGCHLVRGGEIDLDGGAWFDDLRLGRTPQLSLAGREGRFLRPSQSTRLGVTVTGLEPEGGYRLSLSLRDVAGVELDRSDRDLTTLAASAAERPIEIPWAVPGAGRGFYRLEADLRREGRTVARRQAAFVVTDPGPPADDSPFGWAIHELPGGMTPEGFADAAAEAGLGRVKLPLWRDAADRVAATRATEFVERLAEREIAVVGLLDPPPDELRRKFAANWSGAGEIYGLASSVWGPSLAPVIARHGARVRYWQLGRDGDGSFTMVADIPRTLDFVKKSFERVGRNTQVGLPWPADRPVPDLPGGFVSILQDGTSPLPLPHSEHETPEVWTGLQPLPAAGRSAADRAADFVRRIVAARSSGAQAVFATDVLNPQTGLLTADGSPTELFLPWRTTALVLRGANDLGPITLAGGSHSRAFAGRDQATIVLWSDGPVTETFTPGGSPSLLDIWGRSTRLSPDPLTGRIELPVGPSPVFITGASAALVRWQSAVGLEQDRLQSQHGPQPQAIVGLNPFDQGVSGTASLKAPRGWELDRASWPLRLAAGEAFRLPLTISLPTDASLGTHKVEIEFDLQAERPYQFTLRRDVLVGLGDIEIEVTGQPLPDGRLEVVQTLTNKTDPPETLNFRCDLFVPGSQRQRQYVVKFGPGRDTKRYYLPDARSLFGQELRLRAEQENGRRVLNYRWVVGEDG